MFKRVMVAVVGIPLLLLVLILAPDWAAMVLVAGMCAIGAWELMHAVRGQRGAPLSNVFVWAPICMSAMVPVKIYDLKSLQSFIDLYWQDPSETMREHMAEAAALGMRALGRSVSTAAMLALAFVLVLFVCAIIAYGRNQAVPFADLTAAVFAGLVFPLMLSCLLLLRLRENGTAWVFVPLCISFGSDTLALFAGMLFGRHKLTPVSPKKTVEGAVGGFLGGITGMLLFKLIAEAALGMALVDWKAVVLLGIIGSVIGQIGDLSFSLIKREFGVKDYGKLLPGHGGILDRFDSVTFVAPFVFLTLGLI